MRNFPKSVTIGGIKLAVRVDPEIPDWGQYISDSREILISVRACAKASTLRETLRHEMMHAALDIGGVSFMERYTEECVVRALDHLFWPAWDKLSKTIRG